MSTITIHIPTSEVGWFEQMVHSMGWKFTKVLLRLCADVLMLRVRSMLGGKR